MHQYTFKAAVIQQSSTSWNPVENLDTSYTLLKQASKEGAELVVFQELHSLPYFCQVEDPRFFMYSEPINDTYTEKLSQWAAELNLVLVGSFFEKRAAGLYHNTALVFDRKKGLVGQYRKMHVPDDPGFYEKYYFTPGDSSENGNDFKPISTSLGKLGVLICWDQWFPEAARLSALQGAEILIYPTAIGWDATDPQEEQASQLDAWVTVQRGHSIANHLPVLTANRVGFEPNPNDPSGEGITFWGNSFITDARGKVLAQSDHISTDILCANIQLGQTETLRQIWPFLRDRRVDAYHSLSCRFKD